MASASPTTHPASSFLPEPQRRARRYTVISVDDHLIEPPDLFEGRVPAKLADRTPRVVENEEGEEAWLFDGSLLPNVGFNAMAGRVRTNRSRDPINFSEMRAGAWSIKHRLADMDLDGVYAELCFPSFLGGFGGVRLQTVSRDQELGLALVRAWNDWCLEEWVGGSCGRMIPCQLAWLHDPAVGADEIRRNAERGFRAVTLPEAPHTAGFPSLHSGYWDPIVRAAAETQTVICVHTGSSGQLPELAADAPQDISAALFGAGYSLSTAVDWLYSRYPVKFPDLRVVISEGGIGWVPSLLDRVDHMYRKNGDINRLFVDTELSASELLRRNFWYCLLDEPSALVQRDVIGVENILFETDYPHADSSWPDTQALLESHLADLPEHDTRRITWQNAAELFRFEVPAEVAADPDAF